MTEKQAEKVKAVARRATNLVDAMRRATSAIRYLAREKKSGVLEFDIYLTAKRPGAYGRGISVIVPAGIAEKELLVLFRTLRSEAKEQLAALKVEG